LLLKQGPKIFRLTFLGGRNERKHVGGRAAHFTLATSTRHGQESRPGPTIWAERLELIGNVERVVAGSAVCCWWEFLVDGPTASFQVFLDTFDLIG
jgi:hypothetical protein